MLDQSLHELFQEMATAKQPPSAITLPHVIDQARARRRHRRLAVIGTPVLAALAVLAITVSTAALPGSGPAAGHQSPAPAASGQTPAFEPLGLLSLYSSFGWLPGGATMNPAHSYFYGSLYPDVETLSLGPWTLTTFAIGKCSRTGSELSCGYASSNIGCGTNGRLQARAPAINGDRAYWAYWDQGSASGSQGLRCLVWEYKPGGWTYLESDGISHETERTVLRVARAVSFGGTQPSLTFAAQVQDLPGRWTLESSQFQAVNGGLLGRGIQLSDGTGNVFVDAVPPADGPNKCFTSTPCSRINGYYVNHEALGANHELWARDADGLQLTVSSFKKQVPLLKPVFEHVKVLGPDPAHWTAEPVGDGLDEGR